MIAVSQLCIMAATVLVVIALITQLIGLTRSTAPSVAIEPPVLATVGGSPIGSARPAAVAMATTIEADRSGTVGRPRSMRFETALTWAALVLLTAALLARTVAVGHGPFANQYEFAVAFSWGMTATALWFARRHAAPSITLVVLPVVLAMLIYAATVGAEVAPLVPALNSHLLLTVHVLTAVLAYGAAAVAGAAGVLYLLPSHRRPPGLASSEHLDQLGHRAAVVAFPLLTLMIILGAIWADRAWGAYWSWDPKETAAMVTWLVYGSYLHARLVRDWRGRSAAWLLVVGFGAVLFTYFGNLFLGGMHAYA
ncbi:MAG: cytochrome c biogenesis protein CcsA [Kineosporiaceae bacterium]